MRIAVCFSGGIRNFEDTFPYFKKNFIDLHNPDIFIYGAENKDGKEANIKKLTELYAPKKLIINAIDFYNKDEFIVEHGNKNVATMFFNLEQSNNLKKKYEVENNFIYDIVIRARLDQFFTQSIDKAVLENIDENTILIPQDWHGLNYQPNVFAQCDAFAIGSSQVIDKYSSLYSNIHTLSKDIIGHPETMMGNHLHFNTNLQIKNIGGATDRVGGWPVSFFYPNEINIDHLTSDRGPEWRQVVRKNWDMCA